MQVLHYYIKNQSRQLREEMGYISKLLRVSDNKDIKQELEDFNLRKQMELLNFNKQVIKKRYILNVEEEERRIQSDIDKFKELAAKAACTPLIQPLIESLEKHKQHFIAEGAATSVFNVAENGSDLTEATWEVARDATPAGSTGILGVISPAISGGFESFTLLIETIRNFISGRRAAEKHDIGTQLYLANGDTDKLKEIKHQYQLSEGKADKYKTTKRELRELLKQKVDLNLNRAVTGTTNGVLGTIGTAGSLTTIGLGITSLLQYLGIIALPASTLGALGLAATCLPIVAPFTLAAIFGNKLRHNHIEYGVQKDMKDAAKKDLKTLPAGIEANRYKEMKKNHETLLHVLTDNAANSEEHKKFLKIYEKENIYRKEKQKLKSISVEKSFAWVEFGAAMLAVTGSLLLPFGFVIAPAVILAAGAVIALGAAAFEYVDKKNEYKYSDYISNKYKQFKNWLFQDDSAAKKAQKKIDEKKQLKEELNKSTAELLLRFKENNGLNLARLDTVYNQLYGKEQKAFRRAAWEKMSEEISNKTSTSDDEKRQFLMQMKQHTVFNKPRSEFGLFSTSTVNKIDKQIATIDARGKPAIK